ncbi:ankyrin repeat domain-containing protein [Pedobacter metabolipauper]|uniref:Ankyrin repeat protein n=1 Tax=Pedobacter metabolipauper TaxID=425513 RepID=A0A4R6STS3_9SPHI|nr:ankyrin repeat domain-containing protein [Pedobacter metabolipauper]TDQ08333.1 ankyrin repeat protein [Pedobacter metabolipauper]
MNSQQLENLIAENNTQEIIDLLNSNPQLARAATSHGTSPLLLACYYKKPEIAQIIAKFIDDITLFEACALGSSEIVQQQILKDPESIHTFSNDGFTPLGLAAYFGHEHIVELLIANGGEVNNPTNNGFNVFPIHSAVAARNFNITKMLIDAGAEVNVKQQAGFTPLHGAAQYGDIEIIILLLEHNANLHERMEGGKLPADIAREKGFLEIAEILST